MADTVRFEIQRSWRVLGTIAGLAVLAMGLAFMALPWLDPEEPAWFGPVVGAFMLALAAGALRVGLQSEVYAVELSGEGVRIPARNCWAPWSQLAGIRERRLQQRVDLLDHAGARVASLEYQLDRFPDALRIVLERMRLPVPEQDSFRRTAGPRLDLIAFGAMIAFGAFIWWMERHPSGPLLIAVMVAALLADLHREVFSVALSPDGIRIRRGLRVRAVPWSEVASAELGLRPIGKGNRALDVFVVLRSGMQERIRPAGVNPFHLERRIAAWLAKTRR